MADLNGVLTDVYDATAHALRVDSTSTPGGYSSANITTNATTAVSAAAGLLHAVVINTKGASANTATVKDGSTVIATIDTTNANIGTILYDRAITTGINVVTATGTAADLTVLFK